MLPHLYAVAILGRVNEYLMSGESRHMDLIWESEEEIPPDLDLDDFFDALMVCLELDQVEMAVLVCDDDKMEELNASYRNKQQTTDVLSFPNHMTPPPDQARHLGDIIISYPQALRQAREIGQSPAAELRFLCLHGTLHLLGYDHETDNGEMLAYQTELKHKLGRFFSQ